MNIGAKELADAYRNAVNAKSCELRGCDDMHFNEDAQIIHEAGADAIYALLAPLLKDQERLNGIIRISSFYRNRDVVDETLRKAFE